MTLLTILFNLPPGRERAGLAYHAANARQLLFGGFDGTTQLGDTWEHDGRSWVDYSGTAPTAREGHAVAYDSKNDRVLLLGGFDGTNRLADTWAFTTSWSQLNPTVSPSTGRENHAVAWDSDRERLVLFGGFDGTVPLGDTWEFDGTTWAQIVPASSPSARELHAMVYDSTRKKVLLFGGVDGTSTFQNDIWEWDGLDWTLLAPATSPTIRGGHALAWDSDREKVVLFAGDNNGTMVNDIWEWDGVDWRLITVLPTPPSDRERHVMSYDPVLGRVFMFGGFDASIQERDVWEYKNTSQWRQIGFTFDPTKIEIDTGTRLKAPFTTSDPPITTEFDIQLDGIASFAVVATATAPDEVRFQLLVNNQPKWWNGFAWADSDGSFARSSTLQEMADNVAALPLSSSRVRFRALLHSDTGATTPDIDSLTVDATQTQPGVTVTIINDPVSKNPLPNDVVELSVTKTLTTGVATVVTVTLKSVGALSVTSTQFITDRNLEQEILSKAGLDEDLAISLLTETAAVASGDFYFYTVEATIS